MAPRRDDIHVPYFNLKSPRKIGEGYGGYYKTPQNNANPNGPETSVDFEASMRASISKISHRKRDDTGLTDIKRMMSRNRKAMVTEVVKDLAVNIQLENTKDERSEEIRLKREKKRALIQSRNGHKSYGAFDSFASSKSPDHTFEYSLMTGQRRDGTPSSTFCGKKTAGSKGTSCLSPLQIALRSTNNTTERATLTAGTNKRNQF